MLNKSECCRCRNCCVDDDEDDHGDQIMISLTKLQNSNLGTVESCCLCDCVGGGFSRMLLQGRDGSYSCGSFQRTNILHQIPHYDEGRRQCQRQVGAVFFAAHVFDVDHYKYDDHLIVIIIITMTIFIVMIVIMIMIILAIAIADFDDHHHHQKP